jgi:putative glutamine amidotransferase
MRKSTIIGITCDYNWEENDIKIYEGYVEAITKAGGMPILLPGNDIQEIPSILDMVDGIMLIGGQDVDPYLYGEAPHMKIGSVNPRRDEFELELCRRALDRNVRILGICRGIQILNVAAGGTLYQDISSQWEKGEPINHNQKGPKWFGSHMVEVVPDSRLYKILGEKNIRVNSFHHQAVKDIPKGFRVVASSSDGVIEAIEGTYDTFVLGVQWHPERMTKDYIIMQRIFDHFAS